jgi:hypothetical protein
LRDPDAQCARDVSHRGYRDRELGSWRNIRICPQTINVPATYLVDRPLTIEADDPQNRRSSWWTSRSRRRLPGKSGFAGLVTIRFLNFSVISCHCDRCRHGAQQPGILVAGNHRE